MSRDLGDHCYNIPNESIYGEITANSISKLIQNFHFFPNQVIRILDIGSGSGYTLCNFAKSFDNFQCILIGIEISKIRANLSRAIIPKIKPFNVKEWEIFEYDILNMMELPTIDICFSFDKTFTSKLMEHIIKLQLKCKDLKTVISCKSTEYYNEKYWIQAGKIPCRMRGSGQIITFFIWNKI